MNMVNDVSALRNIVNFINTIVIEAVEHGGDSGGPYFTNEKDLVASLRSFIDYICNENKELTKQFPLEVVYDNSGFIPQIAIVVN